MRSARSLRSLHCYLSELSILCTVSLGRRAKTIGHKEARESTKTIPFFLRLFGPFRGHRPFGCGAAALGPLCSTAGAGLKRSLRYPRHPCNPWFKLRA